MTATAIIGAQHGSEGKGVIASVLAGRFDAAVRVGGPNAGHSIFHKGRVYKMRGVPVAWINPACDLYIGAGAVVDLDLLAAELRELPGVFVRVDEQAVVVTHSMQEAEQAMGMRESIGSTTEGVGMARISKIERLESDHPLIKHHQWDVGDPWDRIIPIERSALVLNERLEEGDAVMLEGTQGAALSLHHGDWPYTTSADTNAAQMLADTGIAPRHLGHVFLVARAYPIRVAGNSGPMAHETTWTALPVDQPERTTVTNKIRRVGEWDDDLYARAVSLNGPCGTFLTFADYLAPEFRGSTSWMDLMSVEAVSTLVSKIEAASGAPVLGLGTGPDETGAWQVATASPRCQHGEYWRE